MCWAHALGTPQNSSELYRRPTPINSQGSRVPQLSGLSELTPTCFLAFWPLRQSLSQKDGELLVSGLWGWGPAGVPGLFRAEGLASREPGLRDTIDSTHGRQGSGSWVDEGTAVCAEVWGLLGRGGEVKEAEGLLQWMQGGRGDSVLLQGLGLG